MALHLIKLSVGSESFEHMKSWQKQRLKNMKAAGQTPELIHPTRHTPKRADELLDGGSIYWVVKGWIVGRQKLLELRELEEGGMKGCGIVYDKKLIPVRLRAHRPFQGWRYLNGKDAPEDRAIGEGDDDMPDSLRKELTALGLL